MHREGTAASALCPRNKLSTLIIDHVFGSTTFLYSMQVIEVVVVDGGRAKCRTDNRDTNN